MKSLSNKALQMMTYYTLSFVLSCHLGNTQWCCLGNRYAYCHLTVLKSTGQKQLSQIYQIVSKLHFHDVEVRSEMMCALQDARCSNYYSKTGILIIKEKLDRKKESKI